MIFCIEDEKYDDSHIFTIAEIDLYWKERQYTNSNRKHWIDCDFYSYGQGFIRFCKDCMSKMSENESIELKNDFRVLQEFKNWLHKDYKIYEKLKNSSEEIDKSVYDDVYGHISKTLEDFCAKYNLKLHIEG